MLFNKQQLYEYVKLDELAKYVLYDLTKTHNCTSLPNSTNPTNNENSENNENNENNETKLKYNKKYQMSVATNVPLSKVEINYTKKYSKYNEPFKINNHKNFQDKLFWIFYKIINKLVDSDLETLNSFSVMKDFKFSMVEKLRSQKNILKNYKISRSFVEDDLTNNEKISFKTFQALCILHLINVIILRTNNTYSVLCTNNDEKEYNLQNYKILQLSNIKMNAQFNNFDVELVNSTLSEEELKQCVTTYFYIENIEKPLKAYSSYKLDELVSIAEKLTIAIYDENGKKKKKQELYETILQKLI
jgi:hypothetical protein